MRMACNRHPPCRVTGMGELSVASSLSGQTPTLVVQSINDVANFHRWEYDRLRPGVNSPNVSGERPLPTAPASKQESCP